MTFPTIKVQSDTFNFKSDRYMYYKRRQSRVYFIQFTSFLSWFRNCPTMFHGLLFVFAKVLMQCLIVLACKMYAKPKMFLNSLLGIWGGCFWSGKVAISSLYLIAKSSAAAESWASEWQIYRTQKAAPGHSRK